MTDADRAHESLADEPPPQRLKEAVRQARIDLAEQTAVVVDLRNAEAARLQLLNDELDPIFADVPPGVELFDRGLVPGDPLRLWIDMIAHVAMGRDKRVYRFVQDTRYGRRVLAESGDVKEMAAAVTKYVARRLVERERMLAAETGFVVWEKPRPAAAQPVRRRWSAIGAFILGVIMGAAALFAIAWFAAGP